MLAANTSNYLDSNTTLIFLAGNHTLDFELSVSNIGESMSLAINDSATASITCSANASLKFSNISQIHISGLVFIGCRSRVEFVDHFTVEDSNFHGGNGDGSALELIQTNTNIVRNSFSFNTVGTYRRHIEFLKFYNLPEQYHQLSIQSYSARVGGALVVTSSNLVISSCHFDSNTAELGGAIYSDFGSNITISNCIFVSNSATGCIDDRCHGGALFIDSGCTAKAHNSTFMNNTSGFSGGAIALFQGTYVDSQNVFSNNEASNLGGTIFAYDSSRILTDNSYYSNNTAGHNGGVMSAYFSSTITVDNNFFTSNAAGNGGGVVFAFNDSSITVDNSSFENNEAGTDGGVMYAQLNSNITVNSSFDNNTADRFGGVMFADSNSNITVDNSSFNNNKAGVGGGAMYASHSSKITVESSFFDRNKVSNVNANSSITMGCARDSNGADIAGGVMAASYNSSITVDNSSFDNNKACHNGGVMYASYNSNITVDNSSFNKNEAGDNGGVMYLSYNSSITVDNNSFTNNRVNIRGGVMCALVGSSITVDNGSFYNNEAGSAGGVIYAHSNSSITVDSSSFYKNEAGSVGGVMCALVSSSITVDNGSFNSNEGALGGVVYARSNCSITVDNSSFDNNTADHAAGVFVAFSSSRITVDNSSFNNNKARGFGGVMIVSLSSISMNNSFFDNNEAGGDAGVMHADDSSSISVDNSLFDNNEAGNTGGVMIGVHSSSITVNNSSFDNNEAGNNAGVVSVSSSSSITVDNSLFDNNKAGDQGGIMIANSNSIVTVDNSSFDKNEAGSVGGVMIVISSSSITVDNSSFDNNKADSDGGVMVAYSSSITVDNSSFDNNKAGSGGGVMAASFSSITVNNSSFDNNKADIGGGVLYAYQRSRVIIDSMCIFINNTACEGAVVLVSDASFIDLGSVYSNNTATNNGGVISLSGGVLEVTASKFVNNTAENSGGVLYSPVYQFISFDQNTFLNNKAVSGGVIAVFFNGFLTLTESIFSDNNAVRGGVIYLQRGNTLTVNCSNFIHNSANSDGGVIYSEYQNNLTINNSNCNFNRAGNRGGVFCLSTQSELTVVGDNCTFTENQAHSGGVIYANESKVNVHSQTLLMTNNAATDMGGAVYLAKTNLELKVRGRNLYISGNTANNTGGGLHAANSSIIIRGTGYFTNNEAKNGGGISLERYAKLYGTSAQNDTVNFISNRASRHGGALYVDDGTNPDMCAAAITQNATSTTECFSTSVFINFSDNSAGVSGSNLFGGLLDRCTSTVHTDFPQETEMHMGKPGVTTFRRSSNINASNLDSVTSHPVQLCFCIDSQPYCNYHPVSIQAGRRKAFSIELIAYDQLSNAVNATIDGSLSSSTGGLGMDQEIQSINKACTELQFTLFSPLDSEDLILSMRGPCNVTGISERSVRIEVTCICPIGFQISNNDETACDCVCHQVLQPYDKTCNSTTQSIVRKDNFWIAYIDYTNSSGYIIHPHCPFDYCYPPEKQVSVNLNLPNGSDTQCASNRAGTLCGTCKSGLSVSLGSSRCLHCPTYWPGLLVTIVIVFILSGIGLVALLLVLNLTVAVGTLNAIILYANIMAANKSALFSTSEVSFASVFISWLNFDLGFDTCFFDGMDTYVKTWLQLAFPAYIFLLVAVIIRLCHHFDAFSHLIGRRDPVATLATLILLSYTKLLQTIISAFMSATLNYPDGSKKSVWLPDATVGYLTSKHAVLFFIAILILLTGLVYTLLLFWWQWFHLCPRKRFRWIRNQKFSSFLELYHAPYTPKHRYWTGLLLLVRVCIYLVSAFNPSGDPRVALLATNFIVSCLFLYIALFGVRIYKHWLINAMETFTYFNIIALSIFTSYNLDTDRKQEAITNISVGITFVQLLLVITYHVYRHSDRVFSRIQETAVCKKLNEKLKPREQKRCNHQPPPDDYNIPQVHPKPVETTYSVVEIQKPHLAPPPPLEEVREEPELESQQQLSEQDHIAVAQENQSAGIYTNKQCLNNCSGIEIAECDETTSPGTRMEYSTIFELKSIPQPHVNPQIDTETNNSMDILRADEEAVEMSQSNDSLSSQRDHVKFPASCEPEEVALPTTHNTGGQ